ncbi:MAG: hypothetical protein HY286_11060 [Planctomycetes bacterium]|nr:hypothetical protein [Planctomycetota bacterium]
MQDALKDRIAAGLAAVLCIFAAGCVFSPGRRDMARLAKNSIDKKPPVILVPGILGSILADRRSGHVEWLRASQVFGIAPPPELGFRIDSAAAEDPINVKDDFVPVGIVEKIPVLPGIYSSDIYGPLINTFREMGYTVGDCDFPRSDEDAFVFHYDFRRDAVESAGELARAVERVRDTRSDPGEKVMIVAHSFGGLIVRYYLMYGGRDVLDKVYAEPTGEGADNVSAVVFMGSPHHGSLALLQFLLKGYGAFYSGQLISSDEIRSMPSAYQLLPCPSVDCYLDYTNGDRELKKYRDASNHMFNIYDPATWEQLGWLPRLWREPNHRAYFEKSLARARRWWDALEEDWTPPEHLRALAVGGTSERTLGRGVLCKNKSNGYEMRFQLPWSDPFDREKEFQYKIFTPGDGRVTLESALDLPFAQRLASIALHDEVHQDPAVLDNIILFLLGDAFLPYTYDLSSGSND